ncbi:ATP-dependent permease [Ephemerocybe angulata]|uniref:ATP-dependent permease n=1 Tax=Ephemerocybe angulata TaxID=980116 RepID=A0A8H6I6A7_9AGAR|nr:ATP-dependent permease [Tulosesus angulatus]
MLPGSLLYLLTLPLLSLSAAARNVSAGVSLAQSEYALAGSDLLPPRGRQCPPCFNCMLPAFNCGQYGRCDEYDGQCKCPPGWGGIDCLLPQCDSLADGEQRRIRNPNETCVCKDGWGGINCNVCQTDDACIGFPLAGGINDLLASFKDDRALQSSETDGPPGGTPNMTCYKGGETVFSNHQMCDVTNRKILDMLPDRPPQVTFSCNKPERTCGFQFWTAQVESFYCALDECDSRIQVDYGSNTTIYDCAKVKCSCVPGRFICGEDGSVNIGDFLKESIRGPATFSCKTDAGCKFEEPAMNDLIDQMFGDQYITLNCKGGECLHYSQVPGYVRPPKPDNTLWVALSSVGALAVVLLSSAIIWYAGRRNPDDGFIKLPKSEAAKLMTDHVPTLLYFSNITYALNPEPTLLHGISGRVKAGQVMAIMDASGAGKSTLLDILARKRKKGVVVDGVVLVNGRDVANAEFRKVMGFVDQEDTLMGTLAVYETVLYSALLRLPREMSYEAKKYRTLETLNELGILGIKDSPIGVSGHRSISGEENRRVSIACELVTSPSILFLDEPTSGLDAFSAFNVVESLVSLAKNYNRTVIFTIHQPPSNIVALFDQLVSIGEPCPPGFNIADNLRGAERVARSTHERLSRSSSSSGSQNVSTIDLSADEERGLLVPKTVPISVRSVVSTTLDGNSSATKVPAPESVTSASSNFTNIKQRAADLLNAVTPLDTLVEVYRASEIAKGIKEETKALVNGGNVSNEPVDAVLETSLLRGRKRASWGTQFTILSGRVFRNLYRGPALLAAHYLSAIGLALICSLFVHNVTNDIPGFRNRLGIFFFTVALFGFSCLSSLGLFMTERILFMRERANGYYSTFTYFISKILFDIQRLRLVPPLMFGGIVYGLVGFVLEVASFWKFLLTLVLFNLTTANVVLMLSVTFENVSVASLVGTLVMLFNLLFTGLLINRGTVAPVLQWLHTVSIFHVAFEVLAVNELRYLQLKEHKYDVKLDVPAATILSTFGLIFWWPNITLLGTFFLTFTTASFLILHFYVKEWW